VKFLTEQKEMGPWMIRLCFGNFRDWALAQNWCIIEKKYKKTKQN